MTTYNYILDGHKPIPCNDIIRWAEWFEKANRHVGKDTENNVEVSTVFLGIDHSFGGRHPILFETMIFGGEHDQEMDRYSTWEEAEEGHRKMCKIAFK